MNNVDKIVLQTQPATQPDPGIRDLYNAVNQGAFAALIMVAALSFFGYRFLNRLVDRLVSAPWIATIPDRLDDMRGLPDQINAIESSVRDLQDQVHDLIESDQEKALKMEQDLARILEAINHLRGSHHAK